MAQIIDGWIADDPLVRRIQILEVVLSTCSSVLWPHHAEKRKEVPDWLAKLRASLKTKAKQFSSGGEASFASTALTSGAPDLSSNPSLSATTRQKKGHNGLSVVSADVIVCQEPPKSAKSQSQEAIVPMVPTSTAIPPTQAPDGTAAAEASSHLNSISLSSVSAPIPTLPPASTVGSSSLEVPHVAGSLSTTSSASHRPHYPEVGAENNRPHAEERAGPSTSSFAGATPVASPISRRSTEEYYEQRGIPPTAATTRQGDVVVVTENGSPLSETSTSAEFLSVPLQIKRVSGGITNELFHVYDEEDEAASVVVRVFGKETDRVISRESELFYQSLFIPTYVHGNNFLVYDFLNGYYTLPYTDMATEATHIAHAVAEFQVRATRAALRDHARPLLRDSQNKDYWESFDAELLAAPSNGISGHLSATARGKSRFERESNYLIDSLTKWVDLVLSQEILQKVCEEKQESFLETAHDLQRDCGWMVSLLEKEHRLLPEGVCHNDLLSANVMIHRDTKEVRIIDFDYTKRSFLLYDVANHFNEYPGLDCDYDTYFPSDAHMSNFIAEYRKGMRAALEKAWRDEAPAEKEEIFPGARELFWSASDEAEAAAVAYWTRLVKLLTLASHLSWSVWSLLQEAVSTLDVDFLDYAKVRYTRYLAVRAECSEGM